MKTISLFLVSCIAALSVMAQSTVTIEVNGNRNREVLVDGQAYTVSDHYSSTAKNKSLITVPDLAAGTHTLLLKRTKSNNSSATTTLTKSFNVRNGYDLRITVNGNGAFTLRETIRKAGSGIRTPMSDAGFNELYRKIQGEWRSTQRMTALRTEFNNTSNYFTATQARQLIMLTNSESNKLTLAKLAVHRITDVNNIPLLYDVLTNQRNRTELESYVRLNISTSGSGSVAGTPMNSTEFNRIYSNVQNQWSTSSKVSALNSAFNVSTNYFSAAQARQLIALIPDENDRLTLAKRAVHQITDMNNVSVLNDLFSRQSSRNDLANYVRVNVNDSGSGGFVDRDPMTTSEYNALYADVQNQWNTSAKVTALNTAFGNTSNFFTSAQARQLILLVPDESNRLHLAKTVYRGITDPAVFNIIYDVFTSQASRTDLATYLNRNYGVAITNTGSSTYRTPMTDTEYTNLYRQVQNTWGLGAKMTSLSTIFANNSYSFTTAQAKELAKLVSSESNRLELAKASYDNITDATNFTSIYDILSSQSSRDELAAWVNSYTYNNSSAGSNYSYRTPMADAEYTALYRRVQNTWGLGAKMSSLTDIFASTSYFFTTAQAKELVKLVSSESNRLQLAKASFDNITDPANFNSMYDVFESQTSRDELAAYVNSYSYNRN